MTDKWRAAVVAVEAQLVKAAPDEWAALQKAESDEFAALRKARADAAAVFAEGAVIPPTNLQTLFSSPAEIALEAMREAYPDAYKAYQKALECPTPAALEAWTAAKDAWTAKAPEMDGTYFALREAYPHEWAAYEDAQHSMN